jgi:hypothetical protein
MTTPGRGAGQNSCTIIRRKPMAFSLSRFAGTRRSVAWFNRCRSLMPVKRVIRLYDDPRLVAILDRYRIGITT